MKYLSERSQKIMHKLPSKKNEKAVCMFCLSNDSRIYVDSVSTSEPLHHPLTCVSVRLAASESVATHSFEHCSPPTQYTTRSVDE